jgi:GNAT superfamily N-acetyltransferase
VIAALRVEGEVLVGMTEDDSRIALLPPGPYYDGFGLEFYDRPIGEGLDAILHQVPTGCELRRLNRELILRTEWGPNDVTFYGGPENWEKTCLGYVLMHGNEILSEATVGSPGRKPCLYEPGVFTQEKHRGNGYGTMVTARLIQEIETMGGRTFWNCAKQNQASAAIARKLGYRVEKKFRCLAWDKQAS